MSVKIGLPSLALVVCLSFFSYLYSFGQSNEPNYFEDAKSQASINAVNWGSQWYASHISTTVAVSATTSVQFIGEQYDAENADALAKDFEFFIDPPMCDCVKYVLLWVTTGKLNGKVLQPYTVYLLDTGHYVLSDWTYGSILWFRYYKPVPTATSTTATPIPPSSTPTATTQPTVPAPTVTPTTQVIFPEDFRQAQIQAYLNAKSFQGTWVAQYGESQASPIQAEKLEIPITQFGNAGKDPIGLDLGADKCEAILIWGATGLLDGKEIKPNVVYYLPSGGHSITNWTWGTYLVVSTCELYLPIVTR